MADVKKFIDELKKLTIVELNELVKGIEGEFGVSAAAPVAVAAGGAAPAAAAEEQTEFTVVLKNAGASKINVIKAVRELTGLGLVEAKNLVEGLGTVKEGLSKADAQKMVDKLKEAGAEAAMQ